MIQINVSQLLKASIGATLNCEVSGVVDIDGADNTLRGEVRLMRTDRGILAQGTVHTESQLICSRCLNLFNSPLTLNIEEEYFPTADVVTGAALSLPDEPGTFIIDEHNILDLTEAIRQYALLAMPMKPLCHHNCAGLCSTCGVNLNQVLCNCSPKPSDSPWAELSKLVLTDSQASMKEQKGTK